MKQKIKSLIHNGPIFPQRKEIKETVLVAGSDLSPLAKRMIYKWAALSETDYAKDAVFQKNFYSNFKLELSAEQKKLKFPEDWQSIIKSIKSTLDKQKEQTAQYRKDHKEEIAKEKELIKEKYGWALVDGKKQPLGGYLIEDEGIFIARGDALHRGCWKYAVLPEDVTINFIGPKKDIPAAPEGHSWKKVESNNNSLNAVTYKVSIGGRFYVNKKIRLGGNSDQQIAKTQLKFEKAKKLSQNWDKMVKHIEEGLKSAEMKRKQSALVAWLIMNTGIRVGAEVSEDMDAGIEGASTLKVKSIQWK